VYKILEEENEGIKRRASNDECRTYLLRTRQQWLNNLFVAKLNWKSWRKQRIKFRYQ